MKQYYTFIIALSLSFSSFSQGYQFGIVNNSGYNFSVIAVPDFDAADTDVSDIGFALMLPAGDVDLTNITNFNGRVWSATEVTEAQFTGAGLNSNGRDGFAMNLPPGQTIISHTTGTPFVLVSFDISNMPTTGDLEILPNTDPIAIGLNGVVDSFYNANIDATSTQNYFNGLVSGQEVFSFETLSIEELEFMDDGILVYPNPTSEFLNISTKHNILNIEMFDILGKKVKYIKNQDQINVSDLKIGVYIFKVTTNRGETTKKVVIE